MVGEVIHMAADGEDDVDGDVQFALLKKDSLPSSPFVTSIMILFITFLAWHSGISSVLHMSQHYVR